MKKQRKHYTPEEKVAILRRHLLEKEPIWKLCDELGLQPTVRWGSTSELPTIQPELGLSFPKFLCTVMRWATNLRRWQQVRPRFISLLARSSEDQLSVFHSSHAKHVVCKMFQFAAASLHDHDFQAVILIEVNVGRC